MNLYYSLVVTRVCVLAVIRACIVYNVNALELEMHFGVSQTYWSIDTTQKPTKLLLVLEHSK